MTSRSVLGALLGGAIALAACAGAPREYTVTFDQDLSAPPDVQMPEGDPPRVLVTQDVVVGDGDAVVEGAEVAVHYLGVSWNERTIFDSSWVRGEPDRFLLKDVIRGWREGLLGMRVGGRRGLVVPPELAYRDDDTLIFVIDLHEVAAGLDEPEA